MQEADSAQLISYFFYVFIAMCQAGYAAWMCKTFAPYAVASGIGEIKVILSGFVIKRFLGGWTLLIKSVGLVLSVGEHPLLGLLGDLHCLGSTSVVRKGLSVSVLMLCSTGRSALSWQHIYGEEGSVGERPPTKSARRSSFCAPIWLSFRHICISIRVAHL